MSREHVVQNEIRIALGRDAVLFRNNVGTAWTGDVRRLKDGSIHITNPRPFHAGLCKGSSDLIGWRSITITQDMVGHQVAVFCAVEVKDKGRATKEQVHFIDTLVRAGGLGCVARSPEEAKKGLAVGGK
jgi:hypothetical protein